jgi:hypothetical protein
MEGIERRTVMRDDFGLSATHKKKPDHGAAVWLRRF